MTSCFFSALRCNDRRGCPVAAIFRAHDWTKSSLEWSRGVEAGSGCMLRREDRREGRCSLRSLTPRYNGAGCTGKIMAVNLWTDSIGFYLSPSFLAAGLHRDISCFRFPLVHPLVWSYPSSLPALLSCLRREIRNRYIIRVRSATLRFFTVNIYAASDVK